MKRLSATNLQGARVDNVGGRAFDVVHDIVESRAKVKLVAVFFNVTDVRGTNAVFQTEEGRSLQNGFGLNHIDGGQAWPTAVQATNQRIGLNQLCA